MIDDTRRNGSQPARSPAPRLSPKTKVLRGLAVVAVLVMVAFWVYVFANVDSVAHPDEFDDPDWSERAEAICAARQDAILALPNAGGAESPEARGELVAAGTTELDAMVSGLRSLGPPSDPKGVETVPQWLDDYDLYLSDRRTWTAELLAGVDEPFVISGTDEGVRVTDLLRTFAEVNAMPNCAPSPDA